MDKGFIWQARPWQAFKTIAIIFSFIVNIILVIGILLALPFLIPAMNGVAKPLVGGLSDSFVQMGDASIERTISVDDQIPVVFTLPLQQETNVVLTEPVPMSVPATFVLPGGGGTINGTVILELPAETSLPVALDMQVPVSTTIPVQLDVGVDIPLQETELATPFNTLRDLFEPLDGFMGGLPQSNDDLYERLSDRDEEPAPSSPVGERAP
ncbi:MAG: hypothetical protein ACOC9Z_03280 [Chloroflexota bacterium]